MLWQRRRTANLFYVRESWTCAPAMLIARVLGYRVVSQSESAAYLVKGKKFSIIWALIWFVLAIFPFVIYLLYYTFKWNHRVYLIVDPATGKVERLIGTRRNPYPGPRVPGW